MSSRTKGITEDGRVDPSLVVEKKLYARTLKAVNAVRRAAGAKALAKLPFGEPESETSCPLFFALESIGVESVSGNDMTGEIRLSPTLIYDLENETIEGTIQTPMGTLDVYGYAPTDGVSLIEELRSVAESFVSEFDEEASRFIEDSEQE